MRWLIITLLLPLLAGGAPEQARVVVHAPPAGPVIIRPLAQTCTATQAVAVLRTPVYDQARNEIGRAEAWSCSSAADAQRTLNNQVATVEAQHDCWYGDRKGQADCPPAPKGVK